jgi:membrane-associated protease RseP (regulator of RpoE activity)
MEMRRLVLVILLALAGCDEAPTPVMLASVDNVDATGLALRELPRDVLKSIGLPYGLAVVRVGTLAERAGLRLGDVVYGVNQKRISSVADFSRLLAAQPGAPLELLVRRGKSDFYVAMDPGGTPRPPGMPRGGRPATDTLLRT